MEWGIRQGYPLSPYIFVLCVEWLARLIKIIVKEERCGGLCMLANRDHLFLIFSLQVFLYFLLRLLFLKCRGFERYNILSILLLIRKFM